MEVYDSDLMSIQEARNISRSAKKAQEAFSIFDAEQVDKILKNMVKAAVKNSEKLAKMAVEETGFGIVKDKILKNRLASADLYDFIKDMKTIGRISEDKEKRVIEIAEPVGVVLGIIPSTNPTSTAIYNSMISLKSRNAIIFSPHPSALKCTFEAIRLMNEAAVEAGAPEGIIGCMSRPSMQATNELMHAPEVSMIIATGGSSMVKAAYSSGKPALGVGPGNAPCYIERSANIKKAVKNIVASKTFDNSTICASEQSIITEDCIKDEVVAELKKSGCYFMSDGEIKLLSKYLFKPGFAMNAQLMGKSADDIAKKIGIKIPEGTKILIGCQEGVGKDYPLSYEKLTCVLAFYTVKDWEESCELCIKLLNNGGIGHTLSLHTEDESIVNKFAAKPVFRILVNCPSSLGGTGVVTGLSPAFTLGCGTWGGSATSDNVTPLHLMNIKRIAYSIKDVDDVLGNEKCYDEKVSNCELDSDDMELIVRKVVKALKETQR